MKHYSLLIIFTLLLLTGCTSKRAFPVSFDEFTMKIYDNSKKYEAIPLASDVVGMKVLSEWKEEMPNGYTGFLSSRIIVRIPQYSGSDMKTLVEVNTKKLQLQLLKFKSTNNAAKKVKCDDLQYSGYVTAFSYQLENQPLYGGQYFFTSDEGLYLVSLISDDQKDIKSFLTSIGSITCKKL